MDGAQLVVVTGPPASGKSTVAAELARRARVPLLAKDTVKEILFDTLGWSDRTWSRRLGIAVYPVLYEVAGELLRAGRSLVLEANFDHERARRDLLALPASRMLQVVCDADPELLLSRFEERARSGARHEAHGGMDDALADRIRGGAFAPLDLDCPRFDVPTDRFEDVSLGHIVAAMPPPSPSNGAPALVIVTGPPASGKSSLSRHLAEALELPFISKDTLKERLYETFGSGDGLEERVERAALAILFSVVRSNLAAGVSVMAESNFDAATDVTPFRALCESHDVRIVQVHLDRDTDELVDSFVRRAQSGQRHPGHGDDARDAGEVRAKVEAGYWNALDLPGALIEIEAGEDPAAVAGRVRAVLAGAG